MLQVLPHNDECRVRDDSRPGPDDQLTSYPASDQGAEYPQGSADESDEGDVFGVIYRWATPALTAGPVPAFGTSEWAALPLDHPHRWVAVCRAALAWWRAGADQNEILARAEAIDHVATSHAVAAAADWDGLVTRPTMAKLRCHRDRSRPAEQDHQGGPVELWGPTESVSLA